MNKDNNGFTLIELVATIALLGLIAIISFVSITGVLKESKVKDCENLVISIKNAAKEYASDNRYNSTFDSDGDKKEEITGRNLVTENYLVNSIINPFDSTTDITDNVKIEISLTNDYSVSSVIVKNSSNEQINCDSNAW